MIDLPSLEANAARLVDFARKAGADSCDVVVASGESLAVSVREGNVENSNRSEADALHLRVFCGNRVASVSANQGNDPEALAERAVAMARVSPEDPYQGLADKGRLFDPKHLAEQNAKLDLLDETAPDASLLEEQALAAEEAGLAVTGITKSMGSGMGYSRSGFVLATSHGFVGSVERSGFSLSSSLVAGEGTTMERDYEYDSKTHLADLKSATEIGTAAGERTVRRLNPSQVPSGAFPIVMDPRISAGVLGTLCGAINASSVARKTSFLRDRMGKQVAAGNIRIIDDPLMVRKPGSKLFDGEGVTCQKLVMVEDGILQDWFLDCATARELDLETNGRASRSGSGTSPSTTNCYMEPGTKTPEEMISQISQGLYLTETIGHGINMVTGDYSKGASGYWIENGEIAFPVAEITVAGNLADMFMNMTPASDLDFKYSTNAPTLLVEGMTIGGK
ncbi:MAG: TldD/PmbA family protein [Rhizobiaceae bacterium]|nr:TldD/PmbA family protein [Rhizobiaceae bacterium]